MIDVIANMYRCNFDEACNLNVYLALNIYCYAVSKSQFEAAEIKKTYEKLRNR